MKQFVIAFLVIWSVPAYCLFEVGDVVTNLCWKDIIGDSYCLDQAKNYVRVLNFNTGWCPACNEEMPKLVAKAKEYTGKPVVVLSLSAAGFENGSAPSPEFLSAWKEKYQIPFPVLASPKDAGRKFFSPPFSIPNFVVIDKEGKLAFKSMEAELEQVFEVVNKLL